MLALLDADAHGSFEPGQFARAGVGNHLHFERSGAPIHHAGVMQHERPCLAPQRARDTLDGPVRSRAFRARHRSEHLADARSLELTSILLVERHAAETGARLALVTGLGRDLHLELARDLHHQRESWLTCTGAAAVRVAEGDSGSRV